MLPELIEPLSELIEAFNSISRQEWIDIGLIVAGLFASLVSHIVSPYILKKIFSYASTESLDFNKQKFVSVTEITISASFVVVSLITLITLLDTPGRLDSVGYSISVTILLILWLRVSRVLGLYLIKKIVTSRYDESIIPIVGNVWSLSVTTLGSFLLFDIWGVDVTPLLASAGIAGVVLGLAARETISNFFGSIALYADNAYETGQFIELQDSDVRGYVRDISIRSTQLITLNGNKVVIPNSKLHNSIIKNVSAPNNEFRMHLSVGISYEDEPSKAKTIISDALEKVIESEEDYDETWFYPQTGKNYKIFVNEFEDSAVVFKILVKATRPEDELRLKDEFYSSIHQDLKSEGIEIPYPQRSLHFENNHNDSLAITNDERNE